MAQKESQVEGIAIIDGAGIVTRYPVPEGARGWLTLKGVPVIGMFDELVWETGQPKVVPMTAAELDAATPRRHSFTPVGGA